METMAPVELDIADMRRVVEQEGGCIVWGGGMQLSPADDKLIRVEKQLDIDSEGQLVASVLSKKVAAGATHLILDLPTGPSAKVRTPEAAQKLGDRLVRVARHFGIEAVTHITDGSQPVGRGIGPALEARDVMAVLQNSERAPVDLRTRSLNLAGALLEMAGKAPEGGGYAMALKTLESGAAWQKFMAICEAQGGFREPPKATHSFPVIAAHSGVVELVDNRLLARVAKYAGAPESPAAGIQMHHFIGDIVDAGQPLFSIHAETPGELAYAQDFVDAHGTMVHLGDMP
jgi:thymidine phosphorylase